MQKTHKLLLLLALLIPCVLIAWRSDGDFPMLHHAASLAKTDPVAAYPGPGQAGSFTSGPLTLWAIQPLGLLPYAKAKVLWIGLQTAAFFTFWLLLGWLYPFLWNVTVRWGWALVFVISIQPIHNNFQMSGLLLCLATVLLFAEGLITAGNPVGGFLGGALCGFAPSVKLFALFLVVFYFINKDRWVRLGLLCGLLLAIGLPFAFFGVPEAVALYTGYARTALTPNTALASSPEFLSLPAFVLHHVSIGKVRPWVARALIAIPSGLFFLYVWANSGRRAELQGRSSTHLWALALSLMVLLNPGTRSFYFIFLVPAFCSCLETSYRELSSHVTAAGMLLAFALLAVSARALLGPSMNARFDVWGVPTLGVLLLSAALTWAVNRSRALYV